MSCKCQEIIASATHNDVRHVTKHVHNVTKCHACHAKRRYVTRQTSTNDPSWKPPGTAIRSSRKGLRTVANGCGRTVGQHQANTPPPPDPQSGTGTLATQSGINKNPMSPCEGAMMYVSELPSKSWQGIGWVFLNSIIAVVDRLLQRLLLSKDKF